MTDKAAQEAAVARLTAIRKVLSPDEIEVMDAICGRGDMPDDVAAEMGLSEDEVVALLQGALDKAARVTEGH